MHLYVAGPMSDIESFNYPAFHAASARLRAAGFEVTNPAEQSLPCGCSDGVNIVCGVESHEWDEWVRMALRAMLERSQGVALLPGWESSRGAKIEIALAQSLGWQVGLVEDWIEAAREPVAG